MFDATFTTPDVTTFTGLDALGLQAVGQCLQPDRAVLACTVIAEDRWCCGSEGRVRDTIMRGTGPRPAGMGPDPGEWTR
ncbi:putative transposase [Mobilicoccus pelagius NBRC 104925]|uniref:Putative transposase n=1 Tax=Mobilicoccus pelagius NBRC 104925 TaxID=1089455 RepID=H5UPR2_9MICO|nr:putative transposase [Mobilicoccus pelagius NBRC 104925]